MPRTAFNLVAVGPYLDNRGPDHAIILTASRALQVSNVNFDDVASAPDPTQNLIHQLHLNNNGGTTTARIVPIASRNGPGSLYRTTLMDTSTPPRVGTKLINSATTNTSINKQLLNKFITQALPPTTSPPTTSPATVTPTQTTTTSLPNHAQQWTSSTSVEKALIELRQIHCALSHPSDDVLLQALKDSPSARHHQLRKYVKLMDKCNVCPMGTQRSESHPDAASSRAKNFLDRLVLDCSGRQPVSTISGHWYFLLIVDDATRTKWTRLLKSLKQVPAVFDRFLKTVVRQGTTGARGCVQYVRTDNGPDFNNSSFKQVLINHSITIEPSPPDASHQRGLAERGIGVLAAMARASLVWSKAPLPFWGECVVNHCTPTSNNRPNKANPGNASPYQMVNPDKPSQLQKLRPFGCLAFNLVKVADRNGKLNPASTCGFFAGYGLTPNGDINGYRVMNFRTHRFTTKINVRFNVQLPALRYALATLVHSPHQMLVGRTITKTFPQGRFVGTITGHSTKDNITFYDIRYSDGDTEQMDLLEVLQRLCSVQRDMALKRPNMHKRLRQSTLHDRARLGKDILPPTTSKSPTPTTPTTTGPPTPTTSATTSATTSTTTISIPAPVTATLRRSTRKTSAPDRLTASTPGSLANSSTTPPTHTIPTSNKANAARLRRGTMASRWRRTHTGKFTILPMITMLVNAVSSTKPNPFMPNATVDGIDLHRFDTHSPPLPTIPPWDVPLPSDFDDAVFGPFSMYWRPAIQNEIDSLFDHKVWKLERIPPGALVLPCKLVFKVKPDGREPPGIDKFKCRYCGKGFIQIKGIHYFDSTAPCASATVVRLIVAIATEMNWPLHGMDVSNAYLNAPLHPDIILFVKPPPTVHVPHGYGLRLLKGLYGTMQGGNRWAIHKHLKLTELGYTRNFAEPSLYHRSDQHGIVIMAIVVDDFEITGYPPAAIARAKSELHSIWDMTDLGPLRYFTSVQVDRNMDTRTTTLKQTECIENILAKFGMSDTYGKPTPCTSSIYNQNLLDPVTPHAPAFGNNYRSIVGSLGYLRRTRPDMCVALGVTAQFSKMGRHGPQHYRALRNIMRYAKRTMHHGLLYTSTYKGLRDPWNISGHVDSDWASWKASRRSRTGYLIFIGNCLIAFGSKLQPAVALSSAEAEYMALSLITRIILWIVNMIENIPGQFVHRPILVYEDNKPCINLADNHSASKYTRHIGICHHFLRDHYRGGDQQFRLVWTKSSEQKADGMTKPLPRADFCTFRDQVVSDHNC